MHALDTGIVQHPNRAQPFTVWYKSEVIQFAETYELAHAALLAEAFRRKTRITDFQEVPVVCHDD